MKTIQSLAFSVHETVLYLDGHPYDRRALAYYNEQNKLLSDAVASYEETYGPISANGATDMTKWTWISGPWPWKYEANVCEN
ncbi:MAG: spore coat protein CotJB [Clostridia bacterium]|nr:spore coat protein CotJB [Clostridia bacterium]